MNAWGVILAAGAGSRLARAGIPVKKQFLLYKGAPLFWHSARAFSRVAGIKGLVFVFPPDQAAEAAEMLDGLRGGEDLGLAVRTALGGERRQDSVRNGLGLLPADCGQVLVHDAARPFATPALMARLLDALEKGAEAAIPGIPVTDTIKRAPGGMVAETPEREELVAVQTPQAFTLPVLREAHERSEAEGWQVTDDAMMVEKLGVGVAVVPGEAENVKITNPEDLRLVRSEEETVEIPVVGSGYDVHKYGPGRPMKLGGVPIPGAPEVVAHSDGDVLLHALADAVLGLFGGGDIGEIFPDSDQAFDNASSAVLLSEVLAKAREQGVRLVHADLTVIAQIPRLSPHKANIKNNIARLLSLPAERVNLKATTEEGLGFTGEKLGIKAQAVVTAMARMDSPTS